MYNYVYYIEREREREIIVYPHASCYGFPQMESEVGFKSRNKGANISNKKGIAKQLDTLC